MKDYNRREDWDIATNVRVELVKHSVNTDVLDVYVTKGVVELKGPLEYTNSTAQRGENEIRASLITMEQRIRDIPRVRDVRWDLIGWEREGDKWKRG